jgi:hypothetical protein
LAAVIVDVQHQHLRVLQLLQLQAVAVDAAADFFLTLAAADF